MILFLTSIGGPVLQLTNVHQWAFGEIDSNDLQCKRYPIKCELNTEEPLLYFCIEMDQQGEYLQTEISVLLATLGEGVGFKS